jgi:PAS domain S-box-containing protein
MQMSHSRAQNATQRALRASEERLEAAQRISHTGDWRWDVAADEVTWSDELFRIFGLQPQSRPLTLHDVLSMTHEADRQRLRSAIDACVSSGTAYQIEHRIVRPDGSVRYVSGRGEALLDDARGVVGMFGTAHDRTERRNAEELVRRHALQQQAVAELGQLALDESDLNTLFAAAVELVRANLQVELVKVLELLPAGDELLLRAGAGWRSGAVGAARVSADAGLQAGYTLQRDGAVLVEDMAEETRFAAPGLLREHGVASGVSVVIHGEPAPYGVLAAHATTPRRFAADDATFLQAVAHVLGSAVARARTEQKLRLLSRAVEQSPATILITDAAGRIAYANPRFTDVTGYTLAEALGESPRMLSSGRHPPEFYRELWREISSGGEWRGEFENRRKNGETYHELATISAVTGAGGEITHYVAVKEDVTENRLLQRKFEQAQKMEAIGRLAGGVAHDFNNVLTAIGGHARLLLDQLPDGDAMRGDVAEIVTASDRAAGIVRQLLAFSRQQPVQPEVLDLNEAARGIEKMLRRIIGEDIDLELTLAAAPALVCCDPHHIEQVLMNLAVNARDAMPDGGRLGISVAGEAGPAPQVRLSVADSGSGMTPEVRQRLAEPFFTTKQPGKGTGLGLTTVYGIVRQAGGHVEVETAPGQGTRFDVYLPAADPASAPRRRCGTAGVSGARGGSDVVLLVEDEPSVRQLAGRILSSKGYRVLAAEDGAAALGVAQRHVGDIDLLLSDLVMPQLGGWELSRRLSAGRPDMAVLFMSGYAAVDVVRAGGAPAEIALLEKPFTPAALAARVRAVLDARPAAAGGNGSRSAAPDGGE